MQVLDEWTSLTLDVRPHPNAILQEYDERYPKNLTALSDKEYNGETPPAQPMPAEFLIPPRSAAQDLMASLKIIR